MLGCLQMGKPTVRLPILCLGSIKENMKISAKESLGYYELKKHKPWMLKIMSLKETSETAVVTGSK
jgi:hypothetical protein